MSLEACLVVLLYLYRNTSFHSFVVLMTIEDRYFSCTGCSNVNVGILTISVSPVCLWFGGKLGWKAKHVSASDWLFQLPFVPVLWSFCFEFWSSIVISTTNEWRLVFLYIHTYIYIYIYIQTLITQYWDLLPTFSVCYLLSQGSQSHFAQSMEQTRPSGSSSFQPSNKHLPSCVFAETEISIDHFQLSRRQIQVHPKGEPLCNTFCLLINRRRVCFIVKNYMRKGQSYYFHEPYNLLTNMPQMMSCCMHVFQPKGLVCNGRGCIEMIDLNYELLYYDWLWFTEYAHATFWFKSRTFVCNWFLNRNYWVEQKVRTQGTAVIRYFLSNVAERITCAYFACVEEADLPTWCCCIPVCFPPSVFSHDSRFDGVTSRSETSPSPRGIARNKRAKSLTGELLSNVGLILSWVSKHIWNLQFRSDFSNVAMAFWLVKSTSIMGRSPQQSRATQPIPYCFPTASAHVSKLSQGTFQDCCWRALR